MHGMWYAWCKGYSWYIQCSVVRGMFDIYGRRTFRTSVSSAQGGGRCFKDKNLQEG